jgi:predicted DNA-binding transcriptional regulator YafY
MLRHIPRYPLKVTARTLKDRLDLDGFIVTKRTIERDLLDLSSTFPLALDDREKPYGWSWQKDAPSFDLPGIGNNEALTMMMVEQHLTNLLPATTIEVLKPYFKSAHQHLTATVKAHDVNSWLNKVRTVQPNQTLLAPKIKPELQRIVTEALLTDKQLQIQYKRRGESKISAYRIHPLALIQRGGLIYLYVRINDYEDIKILALHRIEAAEILSDPTQYPENFDIDQEIAKGRLDFGAGDTITLKAKFTAEAGDHLFETPLSLDQSIDQQDDGSLLVTVDVADTPQLLWWLLALGAGVEVLEPLSLREKIADSLSRAATIYQSVFFNQHFFKILLKSTALSTRH